VSNDALSPPTTTVDASGDKQFAKQYQQVLDKLFITFARVPDFTWKVFDDLAAYQPDAKQRNAMFVRLCGLYEAAERPDLACEARLKLADADGSHPADSYVDHYPYNGSPEGWHLNLDIAGWKSTSVALVAIRGGV